MKVISWLPAILILLSVVALGVLAVIYDFAHIPCQDATWDAAKKTCVPTP